MLSMLLKKKNLHRHEGGEYIMNANNLVDYKNS